MHLRKLDNIPRVIGRQADRWRIVSAGLIGYARVSTGGQSAQRQVDELRKAGCAEILEETASGADRSRPVLATLLRRIRKGETLVVVKLDRLDRSLEHLLEVVCTLEARGAWLRVLGDPIDTATLQCRFMLQMLGAVAEFERAVTVRGACPVSERRLN